MPAGASAARRVRSVVLAALGRAAAAYRALAWLPLWFMFLSSANSALDPPAGPRGGDADGGGGSSGGDGLERAAAIVPSVPAIAYVLIKLVYVLDCVVRCVALLRYGMRWQVVWAVPAPAPPTALADRPAGGDAGAAQGDQAGDTAAAAAAGAAPDAEEDNCPICQDAMADAVALVPCGHRFCRECATTWIEGHQSNCPVCRQPVAQDAHPPCMDGGNGAVSFWPMLM